MVTTRALGSRPTARISCRIVGPRSCCRAGYDNIWYCKARSSNFAIWPSSPTASVVASSWLVMSTFNNSGARGCWSLTENGKDETSALARTVRATAAKNSGRGQEEHSPGAIRVRPGRAAARRRSARRRVGPRTSGAQPLTGCRSPPPPELSPRPRPRSQWASRGRRHCVSRRTSSNDEAARSSGLC